MSPTIDDYRSGTALEPKQDRSRNTRRLLLDAAVDELLEHGYINLTTSAVAQRAGVSRGAQQNHFPNKATLVGEALRHLADQELSHLHAALEQAPVDVRERAVIALDIIAAQYRGPFFRVVVELALASRQAPELRELVAAEERGMVVHIEQIFRDVFGADELARPGFAARRRSVLAMIRGLGMLHLLGHSEEMVDAQWAQMRCQAADLLLRTDSSKDAADPRSEDG